MQQKIEAIHQKIEKLVNLNCNNAKTPLNVLWRELPYLDQESNQTLKKYKLVLKNTNLLRPENGTVAISPGFKYDYFCSFLKAAYVNQYRPDENNGGFYDIIFAHQHSIVALTYSEKLNPHGHDGLADRMLIAAGDARNHFIVGGGIKFDGQKFITSELSGHYGHLWTNELRQKICYFISNTTGYEVEHQVWDKPITFSSKKSEKMSTANPCSLKFFTPIKEHSDEEHSDEEQTVATYVYG